MRVPSQYPLPYTLRSLQQKATKGSKDLHANKSVTKCGDIYVRCGTCPF